MILERAAGAKTAANDKNAVESTGRHREVCWKVITQCVQATAMFQRIRVVRSYVSKVVEKKCTLSSSFRPSIRRFATTHGNNNFSPVQRIAATKKWFETIIMGEKLCPFAPPLLKNGGQALRIVASKATTGQEAVDEVALEANVLVGDEWDSSSGEMRPETTLLVMDAPFVQDFTEFVRLSWELQEQAVVANGFAEKLQLVLFHPLAIHQTYSSSLDANPGDYTIRSPFPTFHLLREEDVMKAVSGGYPDLESLPARNQSRLISQGLDVCKSRLEQCYDNSASKVDG